ncbi:NAD(P)-dependent oxidoreductase [Sinorhizobium meliloti]|uniref:NAD(P)-dependent oxidoreductase n=1 Tax=Rhizobium meliloti TaxID=382 RepID=UPI003F18F24B
MSGRGRTAVLGCGLMGSALIRILHAKGQAVVGWNRSPTSLKPLQEDGIPATTDLSSALAGSDIVVVVLSSYDVVRSVLATAGLTELSGKIIVNLSSGSAQDARDMREWAHDRNAEYVDGSIWVLPNMIGAPDTVLSCAGPVGLWERVQGVIKLLGGASFHAGEAIENGNVLEACFPGAFYMTAQHCFVEALVRAKRLGIGLDVITRAVTPSMKLLQTSLDDLLDKVKENDIAAHEASLDVWSHAAEGYGKISTTAGLQSPFLDVLRGQLRSAIDAGLGQRGAAAIVGHIDQGVSSHD